MSCITGLYGERRESFPPSRFALRWASPRIAEGLDPPATDPPTTVGLLLERHRLLSLRDIQVHHAKLVGHDAIGRKEEVP